MSEAAILSHPPNVSYLTVRPSKEEDAGRATGHRATASETNSQRVDAQEGNGGTKKESPGNSTKVDHFSGLVVNALKKHLPLDRKAKLVFQESAQSRTIAWLSSCLEMKTGNNRNQHQNLGNTKITINQLITS